MSIASLLIFLGILFALVIIHELGHFVFAKLVGMRVDEFAFGFPPRLWSKKVGETRYIFNALPLGGYVKIFGEQGLSEEEKDLDKNRSDIKRSFENKSVPARLFVLAGGVIFNILACVVLLAVGLMMDSRVGLSQEEVAKTPFAERELTVVSVHPESNLHKQGLREGAQVFALSSANTSLSGEALQSASAVAFIQQHPSELLNITVKDGDKQVVYAAVPQAGLVEGKKVLGIGLSDTGYVKYGFVEAFQKAESETVEYTKIFLSSFVGLVKGIFDKDVKVTDQLAGPVGMAVATKDISNRDISQIIFFAAMISLSLAVFNILPIPALDGGRILFVLAEVPLGLIWKKKLPKNIEQTTHALGFMFLIGLMIFVTYFDILKIFK
jgi:regulator of sigma E protease